MSAPFLGIMGHGQARILDQLNLSELRCLYNCDVDMSFPSSAKDSRVGQIKKEAEDCSDNKLGGGRLRWV